MLAIGCLPFIMGMFGAFHRHHIEPPPEFTIVCDGNGHFGAMFNGSHYVLGSAYGAESQSTRQNAIAKAWEYHEWALNHTNDAPMPTYNWHDCDK